jgi:hypothetical protein
VLWYPGNWLDGLLAGDCGGNVEMNMASTLIDLEQRVAALERELSSLRQILEAWTSGEMLLEDEKAQEEAEAAWERVKEEMGIRGEPIGAEKLREMMLARGIKPEDNMLSRGIIEMREE